MRSVVITILMVLLGLYAFAVYIRRTSMFVPSRFPEGTWDTSTLPMQPEDVTFTTSDGVRLHGWWFRGGNRVMVWCHGNAGNITERAPMAAEFARRGVSTLVFDWRGYGKSEGHPSESRLFRDALAAYDFAHTRTDEIAVYGESLGGPFAAFLATQRRVRCVVIENTFPSLRAIGNALYRPLPLGWFAPFALSTTDWLNKAGVPVLVMHGKRDAVIPFELGMQLYNELRVPKQLLTSETSGHCEMVNAEPQKYYDTVVRFVNDN